MGISKTDKPILIDLFCGAGGASRGYQEAGFYVIGVDINAQPNYVGDEFIQADAVEFLERLVSGGTWEWIGLGIVAAVHASPPCQAYCAAATTRKRNDHPELLEPIRKLLRMLNKPWVLENVPTAPMPDSFILCGSTFNLPIIRHRRFEVEPKMEAPENPKCPQKRFDRSVTHGPGFYPYARKTWEPDWRKHVIPAVWPWMSVVESRQAIPPAYTKHIGKHLQEVIA